LECAAGFGAVGWCICSIALYTQDFYVFALTKLNPGGILVTQSGPGSVLNITECGACIHQTLRTAFKYVVPYTVDIPSFGCNWGFNLAFNKEAPVADKLAAVEGADDTSKILAAVPAAEFDARIEARGLTEKMQFLDGITAVGILAVPMPLRKAIRAETRIMTMANPVFMH
jgi:predicted membrane-bound spermidine synthase